MFFYLGVEKCPISIWARLSVEYPHLQQKYAISFYVDYVSSWDILLDLWFFEVLRETSYQPIKSFVNKPYDKIESIYNCRTVGK